MDKKLYRDDFHKNIGGVCAGLADYFGVDVSVVRVLFLLALVLKGGGLLIYIVLWIVLPKKPYGIPPFNRNIHVDYTVPPTRGFNQPAGSFGQPTAPPPVFTQPVKQRSKASVIAGAILILLGTCFLLDQFDFIPDFDFEHFFLPAVFIGVGLAVLFTGKKKQPWDDANWHKQNIKTEPETNENNNTTTI